MLCCNRSRSRRVPTDASGSLCLAATPETPRGSKKFDMLKTIPVRRDFKLHRMGFKSQDMEDLTEEERIAWHRPHHCTDVGALATFLLGLCLWAWLVVYATDHGDLRRLYHGINFHGELCGVDLMVASSPYLFWCSKPLSPVPETLSEVLDASWNVDLDHPICVQECPTGARTHHQCYQSKVVAPVKKDAVSGTFVQNVTYKVRLVRDYPTQGVAGHYCLPQNVSMQKQLRSKVEHTTQSIMIRAGQVPRSWAALLSAAGLAVLLGYIYLFSIGRLVDEAVYAFLALAIALPLLAGVAILLGALYESETSEFLERYKGQSRFPSSGIKNLDFFVAAACFVVSIVVALAACCLQVSLKAVPGVIDSCTEAVRAMPALCLAPILSVLCKVVIFALEVAGLVLLLSCGKVERLSVFQAYVPDGITRKIAFDGNELTFVAFYCFMALWVVELTFAMEQFVVAYSVQLWFFKEYECGRKGLSALPMVRGFLVGVKYHLGTLALGSLLLTFLEPLRVAVDLVYRQIQAGKEVNLAGSRLLALSCCCCLSCFDCFIRFMSQNAYIVTAVESEPFCNAAEVAYSITANEISTMGTLSASLYFFTMVGFVAITSLGACFTWFLVHVLDTFKDPASPHFVANPEVITAVAVLISAVVAGTFTVMFHTVAEAMLFCWALDRKYREEHNMPPGNNVPRKLSEVMDGEGEFLLG